MPHSTFDSIMAARAVSPVLMFVFVFMLMVVVVLMSVLMAAAGAVPGMLMFVFHNFSHDYFSSAASPAGVCCFFCS